MKTKTVSKNEKTPNSRNRIQITPTDRTRAILERYREITGKSMASMISELLDDSAPVLLETLEIVERYKNKPTMARDAILDFAQSGHDKITAIEKQIQLEFKRKGRKPKQRAE